MFLFGIFTSHIPYIVLMVFYASVLLFGVEKATKGELQSEQKTFVPELYVDHQFCNDDAQKYIFNQEFSLRQFVKFEPFIFKRKLKPLISHSLSIRQANLYSTFSNRPPPAIGLM
ncbi:MAG: hypothetical protein ACOC1D_03960 [Prolixibacteraceae bacterium]